MDEHVQLLSAQVEAVVVEGSFWREHSGLTWTNHRGANSPTDGSWLRPSVQQSNQCHRLQLSCAPPPKASVTELAEAAVHGKVTKRTAACEWMEAKRGLVWLEIGSLKDEIVSCTVCLFTSRLMNQWYRLDETDAGRQEAWQMDHHPPK